MIDGCRPLDWTAVDRLNGFPKDSGVSMRVDVLDLHAISRETAKRQRSEVLRGYAEGNRTRRCGRRELLA